MDKIRSDPFLEVNPLRSLLILTIAVAALGAAGCNSTPKSTEDRSKAAVALYKDGVQQFNDGKIDAGIAALKKANETQPGYTLLRYDLARMLLVRAERGDLEGMRLMQAAKQDRMDGKVEEGKQKEDEAAALHRNTVADLREAQGHFLWTLEQWPYEANVPYFLSIVMTGLGDYQQAKEYLKRAMEVGKPSGPQLQKLERGLEMLEQAEVQDRRLRDK
jgi:tetratricopeptide (TPR) repeat protein